MILEYVQYMRPNGHQVRQEAEAPDNLQAKYNEIHAAGCRLAAEVLLNGDVSLTIEAPADIGDYAIKVVPNGPMVPGAWEQLIQEFDLSSFQKWMEAEDADSGVLGKWEWLKFHPETSEQTSPSSEPGP